MPYMACSQQQHGSLLHTWPTVSSTYMAVASSQQVLSRARPTQIWGLYALHEIGVEPVSLLKLFTKQLR